MRIGGLMLLIVMVAGAVFGMYAIANFVNMQPPVDSAGNTVSNATNTTQTTVATVSQIAPTAGVFIVLILAVIVLAVIVVYFASAGGRRGRY